MLSQHQKAASSGPKGSGSDERSSARGLDHHEDPYNQLAIKLAAEEALASRQLVYDSMSTILEVDSEGSEDSSLGAERSRLDPRQLLLMEEPLRVTATPQHQRTGQGGHNEGATNVKQQQPVSPVGLKKDTLGGTLSALALQVEKLRRSSLEHTDSPVVEQQQLHPLDSLPEEVSSAHGVSHGVASGQQEEAGTASPLESLMMIALSPAPIPGGGLQTPVVNDDSPARVVELSNKSTLTAIDLQLMDQMVERFFVQTRDKGTQSIEFDCEAPESLAAGTGSSGVRGKRKEMKSVAVGTEKFSRQRFSLLPPTSTRATQTNSTLEHQDIGTSETRRFKLNHLQIQPVRRLSRASPPAPGGPDELMQIIASERQMDSTKSAAELSDSLAGWPHNNGDASKMDPPKESTEDSLNDIQHAVDESVSSECDASSLSNADSLKVLEEQSKREVTKDRSEAREEKRPEPGEEQQELSKKMDGVEPEVGKARKTVVEENQAPIPSVKTELRVVIELKDSRRRHVSELKSSSQMNNSKLSRTTELSSSRYVSSSPNQVLERLNAVGQRHSLMLNGEAGGGCASGFRRISTPPGAVLAANQSAISRGGRSSASSLAGAGVGTPTDPHWHQVRNSSVRNVIEAPASSLTPRRLAGRKGRSGECQVSAVLSSETKLVERANEEAAIELSQRVLRRARNLDGSQSERTLVESQASFDEAKPVREQLAKPLRVANEQQATSAASAGAAPNSNSALPSETAKLTKPAKRAAVGRLPVLSDRRPDERQPPRGPNQRPESAASQRSMAGTSPMGRRQLDIHEEREERRQLTQNGRLVFDDRLRERHFQSQSVSPEAASPAPPNFRSGQSPGSGQQQRGRAPTPVVQTGGGSQLSSDPETMDSGFGAQSGVGSGLNAGARRSPIQQQQPHQEARLLQSRLERQLADSGQSLNFVDDDVDDDQLMEELDRFRGTATPQSGLASRPAGLARSPLLNAGSPSARVKAQHRKGFMDDSSQERAASLLIEPPAAFSCSHLDRVGLVGPEVGPKGPPAAAELSTCLTRTKRRPGTQPSSASRTRTRLDQNLVGPASRFRSQVTFESDTDSMAERHSSAAESSATDTAREAVPRKELVSETQFEAHNKPTTKEQPCKPGILEASSRHGSVQIGGAEPNGVWDYSLRVNRMRGSKVDSRAKYSNPLAEQPIKPQYDTNLKDRKLPASYSCHTKNTTRMEQEKCPRKLASMSGQQKPSSSSLAGTQSAHYPATKLNTKRAQLRKQTSSQQQLDSCGSSDSGQGTNSTGSLTASSLASVAGATASAMATSANGNGSSCASSSLRVSSASSSSSAISLAGSLSSSTLFALCNSIGLQSVAPTASIQEQRLSEDLCAKHLQQASLESPITDCLASSLSTGAPQTVPNQVGVQAAIAKSPLLHQLASRRRQSWLSGLESHQNSSSELATYCQHHHYHQQSTHSNSSGGSSFGAQCGDSRGLTKEALKEPVLHRGSTEPMLPLGAFFGDEQDHQNDASGNATLNSIEAQETYSDRKKESSQRSVRLGGRIRRIQFFPRTDDHSSGSSTSTSSSSLSSLDGHSWAAPASHNSNSSLSNGSSTPTRLSSSSCSADVSDSDNNHRQYSSSEDDSSSDPQSSRQTRKTAPSKPTKASHTNKNKPTVEHQKSRRDRVVGRLLVCLDLNELELRHLKRSKVLHSPRRLARHLVQVGRVRHQQPLLGPKQATSVAPTKRLGRRSSLFWRLVASFSSSSNGSSSSSPSIPLSSPSVSSAASVHNTTEQPANKQVDQAGSPERTSSSFECPLVELLRATDAQNTSLLRQRLLLSSWADAADFDIQYTDTWDSRAPSAANLERLDSIDEEAACSSSQQQPSIDLIQDREDWCGVQHATGRLTDGGVQLSSGDEDEEEEETGRGVERNKNEGVEGNDSSGISDEETTYRHQVRHKKTRKKNKISSRDTHQMRDSSGLGVGSVQVDDDPNGISEVDRERYAKVDDTDHSGQEDVGSTEADGDCSYRVLERVGGRLGGAVRRTTRQSGEQEQPQHPRGSAASNLGCPADLDAQQPTTDDDYFYDDELYIGATVHRGPMQRCTPQRSARCGQVVGANLGAGVGAISLEPASSSIPPSFLQHTQQLLGPTPALPLLFWGPSMRRVSCPVGQPLAASYSAAAWRQLCGLGSEAQAPPAVLCQGCLRAFAPHYLNRAHRLGSTSTAGARDSFSSVSSFGQQPTQPLDSQLGAKLKLFSRRSPSSLRKASLTTCSDYFSSFDQSCTTEPAANSAGQPSVGTNGDRHASLVSVASSEGCWRAGGASGGGLGDLALANWLQRARPSLGQVASSATGAAPQDTYYGGVRQSGGLQQAAELRRQSTITGFDHQRIQPAQRSPSLCLAGQHHQRRLSDRSGLAASAGLGPAAQRSTGGLIPQAPTSCRLSPTHSTGGSSSSSSSPTNGQSWTPGGLGSAQHHQQAGQFQQRYPPLTSGGRRHYQAGGAAFSRARLESLESDRGSSPTSWSASSCSLRSPTGVHPQPQSIKNPLSKPKKFPAASKLAGSSVCLFPSRNQFSKQQQQQLQQQQAVYFFLCCCQRNREPPIQPGASRAPQAQPQPQIVTSERALNGSRVPLVARPAIVSSPASAPHPEKQLTDEAATLRDDEQQQPGLHQQGEPSGSSARMADCSGPKLDGSSGARKKQQHHHQHQQQQPVFSPVVPDQSPLEEPHKGKLVNKDELPASSELNPDDEEKGKEEGEDVEPLERQLSRLLSQLELLKRTALLNASGTGNGVPTGPERPGLASATNTNWPWQLLETVSRQLLETEQLLALFGVAPSALIETGTPAPPREEPSGGRSGPGPVSDTHSAKLSMGERHRSAGCSQAGSAALLLQGYQYHQATKRSAEDQVRERSLDQARYLYSTLTSNAGALLAVDSGPSPATPSASCTGASSMTPSSSPSSTGAAAAVRNSSQSPSRTPQRKQAQFVKAPDRRRPPQWTTTSSAGAQEPTTCVSPSTPDATKTTTASRRKKYSSSSSSFSSSSSSSDDEHRPHAGAAEKGALEWADLGPEVGSEQPPELTSPKQPLAPAIGVKCGAATKGTSTMEGRRCSGITRGSGSMSQAASRSSSMGAGALDVVGGGGGSNSLASSNQLQPGSMDPAMHALWAQGADLDTGNGNFIMATRRRRSVHVLHQSQQLQQLQQQQQQLQLQLYNQPTGASLAASEGALSSGASGGGPSTAASGNVKCFKIDEHAPAVLGQASADPATTSSSNQLTRRLKQNELMRLRVNSSSMDAAALAGQLLPEEAQQERLHSATLTGAGQEVGHEPAKSSERRVIYLGDLEYHLDELESANNQLLSNLFDWNYPIFKLADNYGDLILSKLSFKIFFDSGFFESFKIPKQAFFNFFHALEEGYHHKPYHNRIHAADVLHAVYYLTSQPIDNFCQVPLDLIDHYDNLLAATGKLKEASLVASTSHELKSATKPDGGLEASKLHNHIVAVVVAAAAAAEYAEIPFGVMGANLTALEVMALYTAAAMHDYQHPGRTNSFLVATGSSLALLYNDRSVLENHHSAAAWGLFYSGPSFNWLCNLEKDEFKRFRFMIIELILATDLMRHYELVSAFNKKLNSNGRHNIDWFCESDRLLIMEIIIKLADVNGPMKGHQLHCQWTNRIAQEFYEQGDEERALNLPVSLYMDRSDPRLPELQKSFINHLVGPLSHSYAAAGFFPKTTEPSLLELETTISPEEETSDETVYKQSKYWLIRDDDGDAKLNKQFLRCTQTSNLRNNFLYWDAKSKEQRQS